MGMIRRIRELEADLSAGVIAVEKKRDARRELREIYNNSKWYQCIRRKMAGRVLVSALKDYCIEEMREEVNGLREVGVDDVDFEREGYRH